MDHGCEALVGFVSAHGDAFELLQLAEEVLDEVTPLVDVEVDPQRRNASWVLRDDDLGAALVQVGDDSVAVEGFVGDQAAEIAAVE